MRVEITDPEAEERVLKNAAKLQMSPTQFCNFILARINLEFPEEIAVSIHTQTTVLTQKPRTKNGSNFVNDWKR